MDEINDFYGGRRPKKVIVFDGAVSGGTHSRLSTTGDSSVSSPRVSAYEPMAGTSYASKYTTEERDNYGCNFLEENFHDSDEDDANGMEDIAFQMQTSIVYQKYNLKKTSVENFPIDRIKSQILGSIKSRMVTIIEGPTGCGKTTQVPQWILQDCYENRSHCNIIVTQPRRIAAVSVAKRVCAENNLEIGELVGYQIGLDKKTSEDTRLQYVTNGVFLQHLVRLKHMRNFTHVILDEVHEREKEMDFLLLIVRKLLWSNSKNVKVILMSATFNIEKFTEYFATPIGNRFERVPAISLVEKRNHHLGIFYLDNLSKIGELPSIEYDRPSISQHLTELTVKLLNSFEKMDVASDDHSRLAVLIFLPGIYEIENLYLILNNESARRKIDPHSDLCKWWLVPLHSTITTEEQVKAFARPPKGYRKIILATNIAESSITVPDIKYVIDYCLTKMLICNRNTNFSSLQLCWASQTNCTQRAGRAGRVCDGKVYRLVPLKFYNSLPEECHPEMLRCSLENLILSTKRLDMGSPKAILALSMDPPDLTNIYKTVLVLKEIGALHKTVSQKVSFEDGDLTSLGSIMSKLPLDVRVSKLIMLGYIFGCLEDCIIMGAAVSSKNIFSSPFLERMSAYNSKLTWAFGSTSDCIAFLNVYKVYENFKKRNNFSQYQGGARKWAESTFVQLNGIEDLNKLIDEIKLRLNNEGISQNKFDQKNLWTDVEKPLILKMVIAGAFYPHYFLLSPGSESDEHQATKTLNGKNPFTTVYLSNMENQQPGALYATQVKSLFDNCQNVVDVNVEFDGNSSKIFVSCPDVTQPECIQKAKIPGKVSLFVYQALKMRQLKIPFQLNIMPHHRAMQRAAELKIKLERNPDKFKSSLGYYENTKLLNSMTPRLPGIDETYVAINITHIQDCGQFWAQHADDSTKDDLEWLCDLLNSSSDAILPLIDKPTIGKLYAVPFQHSSSSPRFYYRARVDSILPNNSAWVYFIDFGNNLEVSNSALRDLNPRMTRLSKIKPIAFKCTLAEIGPSYFKDPRGYWTKEANEFFFNLTNNKTLHGKVFSVVNSVVSLELYAGQKNINEFLLEKNFGQVTEESYASKVNKDLRDRVIDFQPSQIRFLNQQQSEQNVDSNDHASPSLEECTKKIFLKGPFSPLETNVYNIMHSGKDKKVIIEWDSVNSILLNTEPQTRKERLLVATTVNESTDGNCFRIRNTTLMPSIPGLVELISLIFCPTAELCCNTTCDRYVAVLCGLGHVNGRPLFPEHDMLININYEITNEDIENINFLRSTMDLALLNYSSISSTSDTSNTIKKIVEKLISRHRKQHEYTANLDLWRWNKLNSNEILGPTNSYDKTAIYPPHNTVKLNAQNTNTLVKLAQENAKIHDICKGLQNADGKEFQCTLCDTGLLNIPSLRLHLYSRLHRDHEKDLPNV